MTLLIEKYEYKKLNRAEDSNGKRQYLTPLGNSVASVTTILDATADKSGLERWRKSVGEKKAKEITSEAANRGTRMHKYLEDYVDYGVFPKCGSNPYAKQAHGMAEIIRDNALVDMDEIWGSESTLFVEQIYAGTTDIVGVYKGNDAICDFKQTNKPKKEEWVQDYYLQMTAYGIAHNDMYGTNIKEGHVFMCSKDGLYQQFDVWPEQFEHYSNLWWDRVHEYYENHA